MLTEPKNRISQNGITVWRITGIISSFIALAVGGTFITLAILFNWYLFISPAIIILILMYGYLFVFLLPKLKWKRWRYDVREDEIEIQHGVIVIKRTLIPMIRVQHVDTRQGPILRNYGLATVSISTAATVHEIPVLPMEEAEEIRNYITQKAKVAEEDV